jgi:II/X family phage/plasmid replication protein
MIPPPIKHHIEKLNKNSIFGSTTFDTVKAKFKIKHIPLGKDLPYKNSTGRTVENLCNELGYNLSVRSTKDGEFLTIAGSYIKWLTGQNIIGTTNLIELCLMVFERVCVRYSLAPTEDEIKAVKCGRFQLMRLDYAVHCDAGSEENALFLQQQMNKHCSFKYPNYSQYRHLQTLYISQRHRRQIFKTYLKGIEVGENGRFIGVAFGRELKQISKRLVRMELTWKSSYLEENKLESEPHISYRWAKAWKGDLARTLMKKTMRKLLGGLVGAKPNLRKHRQKLSNMDRLAVAAHRAGVPVESLMSDKRSFKRLRDKILQNVGIDIALPQGHHLVGPDFVAARELLDSRIKYRSSHELFLFMVDHLDAIDLDETSAVDELLG